MSSLGCMVHSEHHMLLRFLPLHLCKEFLPFPTKKGKRKRGAGAYSGDVQGPDPRRPIRGIAGGAPPMPGQAGNIQGVHIRGLAPRPINQFVPLTPIQNDLLPTCKAKRHNIIICSNLTEQTHNICVVAQRGCLKRRR